MLAGQNLGERTGCEGNSGSAEFDRVADLIVNVLRNTTPATTASGQPGKAKYVLADGLADRTRAACADLLADFPLYPGLQL